MSKVILILLGVLLAAGNAYAVVVTFDTDLEGMVGDTFDPGPRPPYTNNDPVWQGSAGSGGAAGWAGCLVMTGGTTVGGPSIGLNKGTNTDLAGDWVSKYGDGGTVLTWSVDVYCDQALPVFNGITPRIISGVNDWAYDGLGAGSISAGWTTISTEFDTAWTDPQAVAAGWRKIQTGSFSGVADNVSHFEVKYRVFPDFTGQLPDGAMYGYDNFAIRGPAMPGDVNNDGFVGGYDLTQIIQNWGKTGAIRTDGDLDGSTVVGGADYSEVVSNWGNGTLPTEPGAVPEPAALSLLLLGAVGLLKRRALA